MASDREGAELGLVLDILTNLVAASIIFFLGWSWPRLHTHSRARYGRAFWGPRNTEYTIVLGQINKFNYDEPSGLVALGDVSALADLTPFLSHLGLKAPKVVYASPDIGELDGNLILLGGPDTNGSTRSVMNRIATNLLQVDTHFTSKTGQETETFWPEKDAAGKVVHDLGVIIKAPNPSDDSHWVIILSGGYGYGTRAAVRLASTENFLRRPQTRDSKCECLFSTAIADGSPQQAKIMIIR